MNEAVDINELIKAVFIYKDNMTEFTEAEMDLILEALEYYKETYNIG